MNADTMNMNSYPVESYERAYRTLRAHFGGRINIGLTQAAVTDQRSKEADSMRENPDAYRFGEIMEHDRANLYRTAVYNGRHVMTVEDAKRIYFDETGRRSDTIARVMAASSPERNNRVQPAMPSRPAAPYRVLRTGNENENDFSGETGLIFGADGKRPATVEKPAPAGQSKFGAALERLFPGERIAKVRGRRINSFPAAALALVLIFALVLLIPVTMTVLIHQASSDVNDLGSELREMQSTADELRVELDRKNDLKVIEDIAINQYGMIRLEQSTSRFLRLNRADAIESYTAGTESSGVVPALLSALGIRVGND